MQLCDVALPSFYFLMTSPGFRVFYKQLDQAMGTCSQNQPPGNCIWSFPRGKLSLYHFYAASKEPGEVEGFLASEPVRLGWLSRQVATGLGQGVTKASFFSADLRKISRLQGTPEAFWLTRGLGGCYCGPGAFLHHCF